MCLRPRLILNPNYNQKSKVYGFDLLHDTVHQFLQIPCGHCSACVHLRQLYCCQRIQMHSLSHDLFYGTLTYNNESLPTATIGDFTFSYVDYNDWSRMIKMIRKDNPDLKFTYFAVTEYGHVRHRPHMHFIVALPLVESDNLAKRLSKAQYLFDLFLKYWRRNVGTRRKPVWKPLLTYHRSIRGDKYNYDLHYLDPLATSKGVSDVAFYVTKYMLKYDDWLDRFRSKLFFNLSESDFKAAWSLLRPKAVFSKSFGSIEQPGVLEYITKCVDTSLKDTSSFYPHYYCLGDGSSSPLSPFYTQYISDDARLEFAKRKPLYDDIFDFELSDELESKHDKIRFFLRNRLSTFDIDFDKNLNKHEYEYEYIHSSKISELDQIFADSRSDFDTFDDCNLDDSDLLLF